jgi:predicted dienelactone hydrolase
VRSRLTAIAISSALVLAACGSDDGAAEPSTPAPTDAAPVTASTEAPVETTEPDAPAETVAELEPFEVLPFGPYDVGVQTITINADSERPLMLDVWFPVDDAGDATPHQYSFLPELVDVSDNAVSVDPAAISADGPFPLVVYSHGSGGLRYIASDYTETIASYGYLVVAPDHSGNTALDQFLCSRADGATNAFNRPNDIRTIIDAMTNPESTETAGFVASVDPENIALTGHSLGGFTTYAAVTGFENELGVVPADGRIDAIIPLAPAIGGERPPETEEEEEADEAEADTEGQQAFVDPCADPATTESTVAPTAEEIEAARNRELITDEQLASVTVPALVMVGTDDSSTPVVPNVTRAWELSNSDPLYRVELVAAQHQSFSNACRYLALIPTWPQELQDLAGPFLTAQAASGCGEGIMEIDRAQDLTNTFAISFLESIFRGGEMIDPETTEIPDDVVFMAK